MPVSYRISKHIALNMEHKLLIRSWSHSKYGLQETRLAISRNSSYSQPRFIVV